MTDISNRMFDRAKALRAAGLDVAADDEERDAIKVRRLERFADEIEREARETMQAMDAALSRGELQAIGRKH